MSQHVLAKALRELAGSCKMAVLRIKDHRMCRMRDLTWQLGSSGRMNLFS